MAFSSAAVPVAITRPWSMTAISLAGHLQQPPDQQVLKTRQVLIDRRVLAGQPDQLTDPVGLLDDVRAADQGVTGIGPQQRGQASSSSPTTGSSARR